MEETRILLLFRDGVVNFDDVSEMQFFTLKKERVYFPIPQAILRRNIF